MKNSAATIALLFVCSIVSGLEGEPIPGADVKVGRHPPITGGTAVQAVTDSNGNSEFDNLPDGTYSIRITLPGITCEVTGSKSGEPIRTFGARTARRGPSQPVVVSHQCGEATVTIEIVEDSIRVSLGKGWHYPHDNPRR